MDYFKKIERSVTISADKRSTVDLQVDIWSQDLNVTKFILKLDTTDSAAIDLTNATVRVAMVYSQDGKDVKIEAAGIVEDVATQKIAYIMNDKLAGFEGTVIAGFYVTLSTGQRIDIQNVFFNMRKSLLDKDLEAATESYYQTFDDIVADVQSEGEKAKTEINAVPPTVTEYATTQKQVIDSVVSDVQSEGETQKEAINAVLPAVNNHAESQKQAIDGVVSDVNGYADSQKQAIDNIVSDVQSTGDTAKEDIKATLPALQGQISELKEDLGNLATFGDNLFNKDAAIIGYTLTSTGEITNDNSIVKNANQYLTSDFIPCDKYTGWFFCIAPQNGSVCFYDESKTFISKVDNILYSNGRKVVNGATYLRFTTPKSELDTTTARVFDAMPIEAPVYDDYGIKINDDVDIKDGRLFVGDKIPNGGTNDGDQTISIGDGACKDERCGIIAIGVNAGAKTVSTEGSDNGHYSVAIGHRALSKNESGDHNTAIGWGCMSGNKTGNGNTAVGEDAMCQGNGDGNTCIGNRAYQTGMGSRNVVVGALSMYAGGDSTNLHSGVENVSVGNASGCSSGSGSWNTCIGHEAQTIENIDRSIAIGYRAKARKSQQAVIGYTTNDTRYKILETLLNGDIVIHGTDNKFRKLTFNDDGSVAWIDVSSDYSDYIIN